MGFNLGAFAGGMGESALETYRTLNAEQERALKMQEMRKKQADEAALADAIKESSAVKDYSKVQGGKDVGAIAEAALNFTPEQMAEFKGGLAKLSPEQQQNVLRAYAGTEYARPTTGSAIPSEGGEAMAAPDLSKMNVYTDKQGRALATSEAGAMRSQKDIYGDVARKMAETGNTAGYKEALVIKNAARESDLSDKFDSMQGRLNDTLFKIRSTAESGGLQGLAEAAKKEGIKVEFVKGANGAGKINRLGPKGDVLETYTDVDSATKKLTEAAFKSFEQEGVSLLGSIDKLVNYMQQKEQTGLKEREVKVKEDLAPSEKAKNLAQASASGAAAKAYGSRGTPIAISKDGKQMFMSNGTTMPIPEGFTKEDFFPKTTGAKTPPVLNDQQKIAYKKVQDNLTGKETDAQIRDIARRNKLPPEIFGLDAEDATTKALGALGNDPFAPKKK